MENITKESINHQLRVSLKLYLQLKKQKRDELATAILAYSSSLADLMITLSGIRKNYKPATCPVCKRRLKIGKEIEFTKQVGVCFQCDHIQTDLDAEWDFDLAREEYGDN